MQQKLSPELIEEIATNMAAPVAKEVAAQAAGVNINTFGKWQNTVNNIIDSGEEPKSDWEALCVQLVERLVGAEAKAVVRMGALVNQAGSKKDKDGGDWRATSWLLARRHASRWSEKAQVELSGTVGVEATSDMAAALANVVAPTGDEEE